MDKVIAVVVTYNRRQLLSQCIEALRRQTRKVDAIFVVNNDSTDDTEDWLKKQKDIDFVTQANLGGAGGFARAIQTGYVRGYHWIWCMDDDGQPKEDALEHLLAAENNELRLLNCAVIDKDDRQSFVWKTKGYKKISEVDAKEIKGVGHPFNGTLINHRIIARVGVPKQHLFLWGDETEYYYRITRKNRIPVTTVTASIHYHPASAFSLTRNWEFEGGWKMYYYIRNRYHVLRTKFDNRMLATAHYAFFLAAFSLLIIMFQKNDRLRKLNFLFWPAADAFSHNYAETPDSILHRLAVHQKRSYPQVIFAPIRNFIQQLFVPVPRPERTATA